MIVILASASPRRYEILKNHGVTPLVIPSEADESLPPGMETRDVHEIVSWLAHIKARAVYEDLKRTDFAAVPGSVKNPGEIILLAADTIVYKDEIIGKPKDEADAFRILSLLRNAEHSVLTGVSVIEGSGRETRLVDETRVRFKDYPDEEIYRFIREEPPYDKSGSYAIQSSWSANIKGICGDMENVMGLPWHRIASFFP